MSYPAWYEEAALCAARDFTAEGEPQRRARLQVRIRSLMEKARSVEVAIASEAERRTFDAGVYEGQRRLFEKLQAMGPCAVVHVPFGADWLWVTLTDAEPKPRSNG